MFLACWDSENRLLSQFRSRPIVQSRKNLLKYTWWWFECGHVVVFVCSLYVFLHSLSLHTCVGVGPWLCTYGGIYHCKAAALIALKRNLCEDIINKDQACNYNWYVTAPSQAPVAILLEAFMCEDAAQTPTPAPATSDPGRAGGRKTQVCFGDWSPDALRIWAGSTGCVLLLY